MPLIYLEEILENGGNKYLSVNIAAKRAREINAESSLPMLVANAEKPVTIAIDELRSGRIEFEELDQPDEPSEDSPFPSIDSVPSIDSEEDEEAVGLKELQPTEEYHEEDDVTDPEETEEGL